jgi:hypothetical protein
MTAHFFDEKSTPGSIGIMQQIKSYRHFAKDAKIAKIRLEQVRFEWLQWLLFVNLPESLPAWGEKIFDRFCLLSNPIAQHLRSRLESKLDRRGIVASILWYHGYPGMAWRVSPEMIYEAFDASEIDLQSAWTANKCGPLTDNYTLARCEPVQLTDQLPSDLQRWW